MGLILVLFTALLYEQPTLAAYSRGLQWTLVGPLRPHSAGVPRGRMLVTSRPYLIVAAFSVYSQRVFLECSCDERLRSEDREANSLFTPDGGFIFDKVIFIFKADIHRRFQAINQRRGSSKCADQECA